jgi:hypothetical protein
MGQRVLYGTQDMPPLLTDASMYVSMTHECAHVGRAPATQESRPRVVTVTVRRGVVGIFVM